MTEEPDPLKAIGRILNRMHVIYGEGIQMFDLKPDDFEPPCFLDPIQPYIDKDNT